MFRNYVRLGAAAMLLAVALGAFGAHGLKDKIDASMLSAYETGVQYHIAHALGLILIGLLADKLGESKWISRAGAFIVAGIVLFSGSLYIMAVTGIGKLGIITPFGGVAFLIGWACLAAVAGKRG
ncbi:DUF423 domain-containing protein [Paenibacillus hemerocallicola]|uniref:DUF423 domain-containing protein n=1 Tax=Paenibacillus hemerocallicola TaxID=1172614 RepID=A0A5C4TCV0_9BACL|nr:DUF423 domain-containing protein [Paenibacillus hemerocallicola]TNJ66725.1 DUF423 domain-containing protein [Paenibacillus hemerocallicola]